jgi:agmatine/peptidylarginine deiminase
MSVYGMPLEHTGGNHMSDGLGMSMSTELVYNENPYISHDSIKTVMEAYLGNDYTVLDYIEYGGIHHIDCWAKFLNPTTIIVKDVPPSHASHDRLDARCNYLAQQTSPWGRPYTIVRVYAPNDEPYTNSLILNDKVYVPLYGTSWDDDAMRLLASPDPGTVMTLSTAEPWECRIAKCCLWIICRCSMPRIRSASIVLRLESMPALAKC